jgi:hypothetical protein
MQSFRQYRRFRTAVEAQLNRDRARVPTLARLDTDHSHSPASSESKDLDEDVERKGHTDYNAGVRLTPSNQASDESTAKTQQLNDASVVHQQEPIEEPKREEAEEADNDDDDDDDDFELANARRTLSRISTQQSNGTALGQTLSGIEVRKRSTREGGDGNVFVVGYEGPDDPLDPHNWPTMKRIAYTSIIASIGAVVGFASSITSSALPQASEEFGVSSVVESLATGMYLFGFGLGGLFAGPISETV